jgi:hypothetical protein
MGRTRSVLGLVVALVIALFWYRSSEKHKQETSADVLADAFKIISRVEGYAERRAYIDDLVQRAHAQAFQLAYKGEVPARRWRAGEPASFREDQYLVLLFMNMEHEIRAGLDQTPEPQARENRRLIDALEALRKQLGVRTPSA